MNDLQMFSENLKKIRTKLNLTQKQLGDMVGANSATISAYETGIKNPSLGIVKEIAEKCEISLDWLCGLNNDKDEIKTYSDIIKLLIKLGKSTLITIMSKEVYGGMEATGDLYFVDETIVEFFNEWTKTKELYETNVIDLELYNLWIEKKIKDSKYNTPIIRYNP